MQHVWQHSSSVWTWSSDKYSVTAPHSRSTRRDTALAHVWKKSPLVSRVCHFPSPQLVFSRVAEIPCFSTHIHTLLCVSEPYLMWSDPDAVTYPHHTPQSVKIQRKWNEMIICVWIFYLLYSDCKLSLKSSKKKSGIKRNCKFNKESINVCLFVCLFLYLWCNCIPIQFSD